MTAVALSSPRHHQRVVCTVCGAPTVTAERHDCQVMRRLPELHCDAANDDRDALMRVSSNVVGVE